MEYQLLRDLLPDLAEELEKLLLDEELRALAEQITSLNVLDRCRCGDDFCASFYTLPKPDGAWGPKHETVQLNPESRVICIDVVDGNIAYVEVHNQDEIRQRLIRAFP